MTNMSYDCAIDSVTILHFIEQASNKVLRIHSLIGIYEKKPYDNRDSQLYLNVVRNSLHQIIPLLFTTQNLGGCRVGSNSLV